MAFSKRQKTDLCSAEFEMNSIKKSVAQHKSELKQLGTVAMNDLKNLKEETALHLSIIKKEQSENEKFREQFLSLKKFFTKFSSDQRMDVDNLRMREEVSTHHYAHFPVHQRQLLRCVKVKDFLAQNVLRNLNTMFSPAFI